MLSYLYYQEYCVCGPYFPVALFYVLAHNCKDIHGHRFTPACTPSASLERTGCQPSSSRGCNRCSLSRQCILRSERFGSGQIRDAAQRPEGRSCGCGGCPSLWYVAPGFLCHSSTVPARGSARIAATQARTETAPQAQRRGVGGAFARAVWRRGASAQYPPAAASLSASGKKTPMIVEATKLDLTQYTVQYELLRFQVIGSPGNVVLADQPRGVGLALFLGEGMPGWLRTVETVLRTAFAPRAVDATDRAPHERSPQTSATPVWLSSVRHEVTRLLASLVLSTRPGGNQAIREGHRG